MAYAFNGTKKKIEVIEKDDIHKITGTASISSGDGKYPRKRHTITKPFYDSCVLVGVEWYVGNTDTSKNLTLLSGISRGTNEVGIYGVSKTKWEIVVDFYNPALTTETIHYTLYFLR